MHTHIHINTHVHTHAYQPTNTKATDPPNANLSVVFEMDIDVGIREGRAMVPWVWLKGTNHLWLLVIERFLMGSPQQTELSWCPYLLSLLKVASQ